MNNTELSRYLSQEQFDSLGGLELDTIITRGCAELINDYTEFLAKIEISEFWNDWCRKYDTQEAFTPEIYFKAWLIIVSVCGSDGYVDCAAHFINAVEADLSWHVRYSAPLGFTSAVAAYSAVSPKFPEVCPK